MSARSLLLASLASFALVLGAGCSSDPSTSSGTNGQTTDNDDQDDQDAGKSPGNGNGDSGGANKTDASGFLDAALGDGSGKVPFAGTCTSNADCATGLCYNFPSKGLVCTKTCKDSTECPTASKGCNKKSVCSAD